MHKLDRSAVPVPNCLIEPPRRYGDLGKAEKQEIRTALLSMQGHRCAYCERRTGAEHNDGHVEHFRNQANHAHLDCDWTNLFWSCNDDKTCGRHKDRCTKHSGPLRCFDPAKIIDPSSEDPEKLLLFVSDGTVRPRDELNDTARERVEETLRIFQLDASPLLRKSREDAVKPYISAVEILLDISPDYVALYVHGELGKLDTVPFSTAVKSFLKSVIGQ